MSSSLNPAGTVLASLAVLPLDGLHACEAEVDGETESLILHRGPEGTVRAWLNICPHAGRRLDFAPGQFLRSKAGELVCAVHGATFALPGGGCVAGPCRGAALREIAVHLVGDEVRLGAAVP